MTPADHYRRADHLLAEATALYERDIHSVTAGKKCALAKIHAQLAQAGAALFGATQRVYERQAHDIADAMRDTASFQ